MSLLTPNPIKLNLSIRRLFFISILAILCWIKPTYAQTGGALNFTNGDYVDLGPTFNAFNFNNSEFTIETWFKTSMSNGTIISKRSVCNVSNFWNLRISSGSIRFEMMEAGGANAVDFSTPSTYNDNTWHHVAVTRSSNAVRIIMDGYVVVNNTSAAFTSLTNTTDPIRIGQSACSNFIGEIDETRIWSEARTVCEIYENKDFEFNSTSTTLKFNAHYNQGIAGGSNGAVTSVVNSASNAIAGTLVSFALTGATSNWVASACPAQGKSSQPISISNISACGSYTWGGTTYTSSGTYNKIFLVSNSCDSLAQLNLTINQPPTYDVVRGSTSVCAGSGTTMTISNAPQLSYCTPTTTGSAANNDFINWVNLGGINKFSGDGPGVYNYYSTEFANMTAGSNQSYTMAFGGSNAMGSAIWIDYNQDGDFSDAGEYVASSGSSIFGPSSSFTVPANAPNGHTRMRIACRRGASPAANQSCGGFDFGEFEDYNVVISGGAAAPNSFTWSPATFLNGTTGHTLTASNMTATTTYTITGTDQNGCSASVTRTVVVNPLPATPVITSASNNICGGTTMQLSNSPTYCTPTVSGGNIAGQHFISLFSITPGILSNTSGDGPGVYSDFTSLTTNLNVSVPYSFSILSGGSFALSKGLWIDLNHDGDFADAGEMLASLNSSQLNSTIIIPPTAYTGLTRMRIGVSSGSSVLSSQSCSGFILGEYEDYTVQISGGTSFYSWQPAAPLNTTTGNPVQIINQTANTTYTLTVTDANGCTHSDVHTINFLAAPNVNITASADSVCSGLPVTLTASGAASYVWSPLLNNGVAFTPTSTTTYTVTGTAANGCTQTSTKLVKVNASPATPTIYAPPVICNGTNAMLTAVNFCTPTTLPIDTFVDAFSISAFYLADTLIGSTLSGTQIANTTNLNSTYSNFTNQIALLTAGDIYCTVILPQGSQQVYSVALIDYNQDGIFSLSNEVIFVNQSPSVTGQAGFFLVPATAKNGLTRMRVITSSHDFGANAACSIYNPANSAGQAYGEMEDYSIFISGGVSSNFTWASTGTISNLIGSSVYATVNGTTTYTVTSTSSNGCSTSSTQVITPNIGPSMTVTSSVPGVCLGNPVTLTASGASSYLWSDGVVNGTPFTPNMTKTYSVIGTNSLGCTDTAYKQIFVDSAAISPAFSIPGGCIGQSVTFDLSPVYCVPIVTNNSPTNDYIDTFIFNGNAMQNFSGEEIGNYAFFPNSVINTSVNSLNVFTIGVGGSFPTQKAIWIDYNQDGDFLDDGEFVWSRPASTTTENGTILIPTNVSSGKTRMRVLCARSLSGPLSSSSCYGVEYGEYEDYTLNITGGMSTHVWSPGSLLTETVGSRITTTPLTANTTFTVTTTSTYGCTSSATRMVEVESAPTVTATTMPGIVCSGDSVQLQSSPVITPKLYVFDTDSAPGAVSSSQACVFNIQALNTITITSLQGRFTGGVSVVQVWIKQGGYGNANVTSSAGWIKLGEDIPIPVANPFDMTTIPITKNVSIQAGDTYGILIVTDQFLYSHPESAIGTVYTNNSDFNLTVGQIGTAFNLVSGPRLWYGGVNYVLGNLVSQQWSPALNLSNPNIHNPKAAPLSSTNYQVTVSTANGCTASSNVMVNINALPTISINTSSDSICSGSNTTLISSGAANYTLQPGNLSGSSVIVSPLLATTYTVTGTSAQGCTSYSTISVHVNPLPGAQASAISDTICGGASVQLNSTFSSSGTLPNPSELGPSVSIPNVGTGNPFPANLTVSGLLSENTFLKRVYLNGFTHTFLSDVDMWLESPSGQVVMLISDAGNATSWSNANIILEDNQTPIPSANNVAPGVFSPTNYSVNSADEPINPLSTLSSFTGDLNGVWKLFIRDDEAPDMGSLASFQLEFAQPDTNGFSISWLANPSGNQSSLSNSTAFNPIVTPASSTTYMATVTDSKGCSNSTSLQITVLPCNSNLSLKLFIEGYYAGVQNMLPVKMNQGLGNSSTDVDDITVELRQATAPYTLVASSSAALKTNGSALVTFPTSINGSYYIVVKYRNAIETWSAEPVLIQTNANYDYSIAANEAYGSNQGEVGNGVWAIFSGDINQDGVIDGLDYNDWENDSNNFAGGYFSTDLNGDGVVDGLDFIYWEQNSNNFVGVIAP